MAAFEYKAFTAEQKVVSGIIDADNAKSARSQLRKQGLFPSEINEQKSGRVTKGTGLNVEIDFGKMFQRVSIQELAEFTSQLEVLFRTGVDVAESLQILGEQTDNEMLRLALAEIRDEVRQGKGLAESMEKHPKIFNKLYISLVEVGQESGNLDQVLARLREYTQKMNALRQKIFSAMAYPVLMGLISVAVVLGLFLGVIPKISKIFDSFGATLPLITRVVLGTSEAVVNYWWLIGIGLGFAAYGFRRWQKTKNGRQVWDNFILQIPKFGELFRMVAISRFCRTLATLLRSGVPMAEALKTARNVVGNVIIEKAVDDATENIIKGQNFSEPLLKSGQFPPLVVRMIAIGERTGEMEQMLLEASDTYDQRVDSQVDSLTSILEPILIVVLGLMVGIIAISILLPMLNISSIVK